MKPAGDGNWTDGYGYIFKLLQVVIVDNMFLFVTESYAVHIDQGRYYS